MNTGHITAAALAALGLTASGLIASPALAQDTVAASCGKQWTVADTNNDLALSREEAEASREMEFSRLDQDGNGEISQDEWDACNDMSIVGEAMSTADGETGGVTGEGFMVPDPGTGEADSSGGVSREEMVEAMKQKFAEASANADADDPSGEGVSEEAQARFAGAWFALHDQDRDGQISPREVAEVDLERARTQAFERADRDGDGIISRDEYNRLMTTRFEAAQEEASGGLPVAVWQYYVVMD